MDELLTLPEVASRLRVSVDTVRYWRSRAEGPQGYRVGRRVLFRAKDVERWLNEQFAKGDGPSSAA